MAVFEDRNIPPDALKAEILTEITKKKAKEDAVELARSLGLDTHPWQERFLRSKSHRILMNCSRQSGKTTLGGLKALHRAVFYPDSTVLLFAKTERQAQILFWKASEPYKKLGRMVPAESESALRLFLDNGSKIIAMPGIPENVRGYSADLVIIDEAAFIPDDLYFALRPMLSVKEGTLIMLTTPYGKRGIFYDEWVDGGPSWERFEVPAPFVPHISQEFLDEERKQGEGYFLQEYMCEFHDEVDALFSWKVIEDAMTDDFEILHI